MWAFHVNQERSILKQGDIEGALNAATAISSDALQKQEAGLCCPGLINARHLGTAGALMQARDQHQQSQIL